MAMPIPSKYQTTLLPSGGVFFSGVGFGAGGGVLSMRFRQIEMISLERPHAGMPVAALFYPMPQIAPEQPTRKSRRIVSFARVKVGKIGMHRPGCSSRAADLESGVRGRKVKGSKSRKVIDLPNAWLAPPFWLFAVNSLTF
jgi:hypothetical protein